MNIAAFALALFFCLLAFERQAQGEIYRQRSSPAVARFAAGAEALAASGDELNDALAGVVRAAAKLGPALPRRPNEHWRRNRRPWPP